MSDDPVRRGRIVAGFHRVTSRRLFAQLIEAGLVADRGPARVQAEAEWECFALYACVRGLVAAQGFNRETARAIDAMHEAVLTAWTEEEAADEPFDTRRARVATRYAEYGAIGQDGGAAGAATVSERLGMAAARHMTMPLAPPEALAETVAALHDAMTEATVETLRSGSE